MASESASGKAIVIAYEETRCCTGVRIRDIRIRSVEAGRSDETYVLVGSADDRPVLAHYRVAGRLPNPLPLTARGWGPFRGLTLDVTGEDWACLLYD